MKRFTLMVQGTTSDAGKSVLVAGLCRVYSRSGLNVAPFKPQNMALNSAVTNEGGEIGRAQALQAFAAGLDAHVDMNPVLIKPTSDTGAQIILQGKALSDMDAKGFHDYKQVAMATVMDSYQRLHSQYDIIFVEGAGSPAEINLRKGDIANMGFAEEADCPVIIVADIDKGGVFAHLVGTLDLLSASEQNRVLGFVINRFRGDISLLQSGLDWLEEKTGKPVLGVIPYLQDFFLDAEDAIDVRSTSGSAAHRLKVIVPVIPRISNHTDFDVLRLHPEVDFEYVSIKQPPPPCDVIILPGSKNVRSDFYALMEHAWDVHLKKHLHYGGKLMGVCGGYQMLGQTIEDPDGIEGEAGTSEGFGYIPMCTVFHAEKTLTQSTGKLSLAGEEATIAGYEIHCGVSAYENGLNVVAPIQLPSGAEGYVSEDNQVFGTYLHGLFDEPAALSVFLKWMGLQTDDTFDLQKHRDNQINRLADTLETSLDLQKLESQIETFSKNR